MPRYSFIQNSFTSGEIGEKLYARTDIKEYKSGLKELKNMLPYRGGGVRTRPGFRFVRSHAISTGNKELCFTIPFIFSKTQVFDIHFFLSAPTPYAEIVGNNGLAASQLNFNYVLSVMSGVSSGEGWTYAQTGDILFIVHNSGTIAPIVISRTGTGSPYTFTANFYTNPQVNPPPFMLIKDFFKIPFTDANTDVNKKLSVNTNTVGASGIITSTTNQFTSESVGSYFILDNGATSNPLSIIVKITSVIGIPPSTTANMIVEAVNGAFPTGTPTDYWYESAWSQSKGYPRTVVVFENRLIFGGSPSFPDTLWASEQFYFGQFNRFAIFSKTLPYKYQRNPVGTEEPFEFTISSNTVDNISWMTAGRTLQIGTLSKEYLVTGGSDASLNRLNVSVTPQSYHGSSPYFPVNSNFRTYFISRDGKSIIEFGYSDENGAYVSRNISTLADDIIFKDQTDRTARFVKLQWQESKSTLWALTNKGTLFSCTIDLSSGVVAWGRHSITDSTIYDIWTRPSIYGDNDDLYLTAYCTQLDSTTRVYTLKCVDDFEVPNLFNGSIREEDQPIYSDFGVKLNKPISQAYFFAPSELSGLTGYVIAEDGTHYENVKIGGGGQITLDGNHTDIIFGLPYNHRIRTLTPEVGPNDILASQGDILRIDRATVFFYKTWYANAGSGDKIYPVEISTYPFTGKFKIDVPASPDVENDIIIESNKPLPMAVLGIVMRGVNNT